MSRREDLVNFYRGRLVTIDVESLGLVLIIYNRDPGDENPPKFDIKWPKRKPVCAPLRPHVRMAMRRQRVKLNTNLTNWRRR